jgi:formamidopyrimidine-DNA glycosylase
LNIWLDIAKKEPDIPELPDLEIFKSYADATSLHQEIQDVSIKDENLLEGVSPQKLRNRLRRTQFRQTKRHGKFLFLETTDNQWLILHFGMTGFLKYYRKEEEAPKHIRLLIYFQSDYRLAYDCQRRFGMIALTQDTGHFIETKDLGPDILEKQFSLDVFKQRLEKSRGSIKSALMNQSLMAGLGNIYSDEALFQAEIHPASKSSALKKEALSRLYRQIQRVINTAVKARVQPDKFPQEYLIIHREDNSQCPKCDGKIKKQKIASRSSYVCHQHQRLIK